MSNAVIETIDLSKKFKKGFAVKDLNLRVAQGSVFGFIGRNGAGKTTAIRMVLGLLPITSGSASVLGMDSRKQSFEIKQQVGYVPESHHIYRWMTISEVMRFVSPFYPAWDDAECAKLLKRFSLDPGQRISELSRGMLAKVALTIALAHDPKMLILDEPLSGLDAIVRREFLESIVRLIEEQDKTVFISSHSLSDVERVADQIAIIHDGKLVTSEGIEELKGRVKRMRLIFTEHSPEMLEIENLIHAERHNREWLVTVSDYNDGKMSELKRRFSVSNIEPINMSLEDIFVALVGEVA